MGEINKFSRWVPRTLNKCQMENRKITCQMLLQRYEGTSFLHWIVTGDQKKKNLFWKPKRKISWLSHAEAGSSTPRLGEDDHALYLVGPERYCLFIYIVYFKGMTDGFVQDIATSFLPWENPDRLLLLLQFMLRTKARQRLMCYFCQWPSCQSCVLKLFSLARGARGSKKCEVAQNSSIANSNS